MKHIRNYTAALLLCLAVIVPQLISCDNIADFFMDDTYELVIHNNCSRYIFVTLTTQTKEKEPATYEKIDVSSYILLQDFDPENCRLWYRLNTDTEWEIYDFPAMNPYTTITIKYDDADGRCYIAS